MQKERKKRIVSYCVNIKGLNVYPVDYLLAKQQTDILCQQMYKTDRKTGQDILI